MKIKFLERELKSQHLEIDGLTPLYLETICENDPEIWSQFTRLIGQVEKAAGERDESDE